jgi:hypothetical protein
MSNPLAPGERVSHGGIVIPAPPGDLRAWVQSRSGPAEIVCEDHHTVRRRISDMRESGADHLILHEISFGGHAVWFDADYFVGGRTGITFKAKPNDSYPQTLLGGDCPCGVCEAERAWAKSQ